MASVVGELAFRWTGAHRAAGTQFMEPRAAWKHTRQLVVLTAAGFSRLPQTLFKYDFHLSANQIYLALSFIKRVRVCVCHHS